MNGTGTRRMIAASVAAAVLAAFAAAPALAGWSFSVGSSCDDGYEWITRTTYRTELRPVTKVCYRTEQQAVTVWTTERRLVEEVWVDPWGCRRTCLVWRDVPVARTEYRWVQVPYETTVYEHVQVPYVERIPVARPSFSVQTRNFAVQVGGGGFAFSLRGGSCHRSPPPPPPPTHPRGPGWRR